MALEPDPQQARVNKVAVPALRFWLAGVGEYVPTDPGQQRLLRMGLLAQTLHDRGHEVTWWCSTYDHEAKRHRFDQFTTADVAPRYQLRFLHGRAYRRNVSLARILNHRQVAKDFTERSRHAAVPDLLLSSMPTLELARATSEYAARRSVPLVLDVRDQHPDIYLSLLPALLRPIGRLALWPMYQDLRMAMRSAHAITATSESFLSWSLRHAGRDRRPDDRVFPLAYPTLAVPAESLTAARARLDQHGVSSEHKIVWYVGTFNRWIDLATPLEAARELASRGHRDIVFVFSGDGDLAGQWRSIGNELPNVIFTGWVRQPEIAYLRSIAWVGIAPYREGFTTVGNKLFEFMSGGLPILSSSTGEPKALIESLGVGLSYRPGDADDLIRQLLQLARHPEEHNAMSQAARHNYHATFRADVVYANMASLLEKIALERMSPRRPEP